MTAKTFTADRAFFEAERLDAIRQRDEAQQAINDAQATIQRAQAAQQQAQAALLIATGMQQQCDAVLARMNESLQQASGTS